MSADRRRQCRVQGGWARGGSAQLKKTQKGGQSKTSAVSGDQPSVHQGPVSNYGPLLFRDPKKNKMPSKQPYNFSWVIDGLLAGSGLPSEPAHIQYYLDENIDILVSLTEWKPSLHLAPGLHHIHLPIEEFEPPSLQQAIEFVAVVEKAKEKKQAVAVHCHWGRGRTGTMIACYLLKAQGWDPVRAITATRQTRPYSVETRDQEQLVIDYHKHIQTK